MNPATLKKLIDSIAGVLTGLVSSFILYNHTKLGISAENKDNIPAIVGFIIFSLTLLVIFFNKKIIDKKVKKKTEEYKEELKSKVKMYSEIIKEEKDNSEYKKEAEKNLVSLLKKDMALIDEIQQERDVLRHSSEESKSIINEYIDKIKLSNKNDQS